MPRKTRKPISGSARDALAARLMTDLEPYYGMDFQEFCDSYDRTDIISDVFDGVIGKTYEERYANTLKLVRIMIGAWQVGCDHIREKLDEI